MSYKNQVVLLLIFIILLSGCISQEKEIMESLTPQPEPFEGLEIGFTGTLALINGILIDGTGADPVFDAVIVIQNGRIAAVGARSEVEIPDDAKIIDVEGATILPGFINAHVHRGYSEYNLKAWAQAGVTTVRDLGADPQEPLFSFRDSALKENQYARLVAAGPIVTIPDGYPTVPFGSESVLVVTSPEDARLKVGKLLDDGADIIKVAVESGHIFDRKIPTLSPEELAAIVEVAHERGTLVSAHVTSSQDLSRALDGGVDDIAHMVVTYVPDDLIERMVENSVYWVPTLELWKGVDRSLGSKAVENLGRFCNAGGKVALGTDYAGYTIPFDLGMPIHEIKWMLEAGMTPMQIIVAGTRNAAHVCNLESELGTLEVGKIADVLVVNGNPLEDIHVLTNGLIVIHNGEVIHLSNGGKEAMSLTNSRDCADMVGRKTKNLSINTNESVNFVYYPFLRNLYIHNFNRAKILHFFCIFQFWSVYGGSNSRKISYCRKSLTVENLVENDQSHSVLVQNKIGETWAATIASSLRYFS